MSLSSQILLGAGLGILLGLFFGEKMAFMKIWGDVYVKLLQVTVLPYIVVSLTGSLGKLTFEQATLMAKRVTLLLMFLWLLTLIAVLASIFSFPPVESASFFSSSMIPDMQEPDYLSLYIPFNPFFALAENLVPAVVIFCIMMGTALIAIEKKEIVIAPLDIIAQCLAKITDFVVALTPLGLFAIAAASAGTMHIEELKQLQVFIWLFMALSVYFTFWVLPGLLTCCTRIPYRKLFVFFRDPIAVGFFTGSLFVVLPLITERCTRLIRRYVTKDKNTTRAAEVIVPASFNFPSAGKLLLLLFVPFAGWMTNSDITPDRLLQFSITGLFTFFGNVNVAIPWLLDFFRIPADTFNLYLMSSIINGRFSTMTAVMFTVVLTVLGASAITGNIHISLKRFMRYLVITAASLAGLVAVMALFFKFAVNLQYEKRDIAMEMTSRFRGDVDVRIYRKMPPALPRPPANVPLVYAIRDRGFVRVGYPTEPSMPFFYENDAGKLVGLSVDLAKQLASDMGVSLELVPYDRKRMIETIKANRMDIIMGQIAITPERAANINFTAPFMHATLGFLVRDYQRNMFRDYKKLRNMKFTIAVGNLPYYRSKLNELFPKAEIVELKSLDSYLQGRMEHIDAVAYTAEAGAFMCLIHPDFSVVVPRGLTLRIPIGFPVRMAGASFVRFMNAWIELKKEDGTLKELSDYWIKGRNAKPARPRWCIARDVLHWIE